MKHKIAFKVKDVASPIEIDMGEETFNKIAKFCQEKYPEKNWKIISD